MLANMLLARPPMDSIFDVAIDSLCHAPGVALSHEQPNLSVTPTSYLLTVRAPGVKAEDLKIIVTGSVISVRGETVVKKNHTHFVNYTVALPKDAHADIASAEAADGVVTIVLPKKVVEVKQVPVQSTPLDGGHEGSSDDDTEQPPHTLTVAAPGIAASEMTIEVKAEEGVFRVTGEPKRAGVQKVLKCFQLPRDADDVETWHAAHVDGLLTLTIPKKAAPAPTRIEVAIPVQVASGAPSAAAAAPEKHASEADDFDMI